MFIELKSSVDIIFTFSVAYIFSVANTLSGNTLLQQSLMTYVLKPDFAQSRAEFNAKAQAIPTKTTSLIPTFCKIVLHFGSV